MLSNRVQVLSESLTIAISSLAKEMKAKGEDVVSFSAGEPDFDTPKAIKDAVVKALDKGCGKYTAVPGSPDVLKAIASKLERENGLKYETSRIITNVGAKHSLFNIFQALIDDGDEVIIPSPYWVSYPEMVKFSGGVPVYIDTCEKSGFKITPEQLKTAITPKSKILVLNSPCNPTGAIYSSKELLALGEVLKDTKILIASDEIYEKLSYDTPFTAVASVSEDMFKRTITINGLSKCGAMPGWRFGYMASVIPELIAAVKRLQSQSTSNISSIVQEGAIAGLSGQADEDMTMMRAEFIKRRDKACEMINSINELSVLKPEGAFYLFVNCSKVEPDSMKFCRRLLEEAKVACVPGVGFGMDGYFRLSFATSMENIIKGIDRIAEFVKDY
ncbi:pyridoxal phosphate-dependent aminotransferase [Campylobacter sp. CCUG 57310]|uniref:pyridoxal phosphate-dependent aminotransferase n=1 Tax=Campylobacter sp. CCUG 57310 TaxID=2517362 RepID=UPI0015676826|nr:pyridoxal phosphate-dependent aminotransferase [Campylobacter sp. CCUG 57310]QKF92228.1 aspartate aminotransferase, class I and II aminotransferase [Campylobacter sp. CCUG 57310]